MTVANHQVEKKLRLPRKHRAVFLARLAHELTLRARSAYEPGERSAEGTKLRTFNELLHKVAAQLMHALSGTEAYPDSVFIQILLETAEAGSCEEELRIAFGAAERSLRGLAARRG